MRQQYTPLSSSLVLKMVKETSPLWIFPKSLYFDDLGEVTFVPSVWRISWLHLELGHGPLPQHMLLLLRDQDECVQGKVTDLPKTPVWTISDAADAVRDKKRSSSHSAYISRQAMQFMYYQMLPGRGSALHSVTFSSLNLAYL